MAKPRGRFLTEEELAYVRANYKTMRVRQMATHLGIAWATLDKRMREAGLEPDIKEIEWPAENIEKLRELAQTHTTAEIAKEFGKTPTAIRIKAKRLGIVLEKAPRTWTAEDMDYLRRNWGKLTVATLASTLHRDPAAIHQRAHVMHLPPIYTASEDICLSDFIEATGIGRDRIVRHLAVHHDFPLKKKKISCRKSYYYVIWDEILDWLEGHQDLFDASLVSQDFFIPEPQWLTEKRIRDRKDKSDINYQVTKRPWTQQDKDKAKYLLSIGMDHDFIAKELGRSKKAVAFQLSKMGQAYRLKKYYKGSEFKYIREHWETESDQEMARKLGRPVKSIAEQRRKMGLDRQKLAKTKKEEPV